VVDSGVLFEGFWSWKSVPIVVVSATLAGDLDAHCALFEVVHIARQSVLDDKPQKSNGSLALVEMGARQEPI